MIFKITRTYINLLRFKLISSTYFKSFSYDREGSLCTLNIPNNWKDQTCISISNKLVSCIANSDKSVSYFPISKRMCLLSASKNVFSSLYKYLDNFVYFEYIHFNAILQTISENLAKKTWRLGGLQ